MKDIGLVGVPFSGKSTLFTAVTRAGSHGGQANLAVVPVPDPRVEVLTRMERSAKTVYAQVRFVDVPGGLSSAQGVARLREADALAIVVRCFGSGATPASELAGVRADLLLADLAVIETAMQKAEKKARGKPGPEVAALHTAKEARALLEEFGVTEPGLQGVIAACYRALDLITFLTTGEDETRAWEVRHGAAAPEAAGVIHTDLQRGFIRAEVIGYDELVAAGSMDQAKAAGKVRVEGKDYLVQEGDILHVRFAV